MRKRRMRGMALSLVTLLLVILFAYVPGMPQGEPQTASASHWANAALFYRFVPLSGTNELSSERRASDAHACASRTFLLWEYTQLAACVSGVLLAACAVWICLIGLRTREIVCCHGLHAPPASSLIL